MDKLNTISRESSNRIFFLLASLSFSLIAILKIFSFNSWQYTSDIFIYDHFVRELAVNHNMVDFAYGNILGDHSYLFVYLLIPIKLLLKNNMVYFLLLINPVLYFLSSLAFFRTVRIWANQQNSLILGFTYLSGFGVLYLGLVEGIYGYHPDTGIGFLFIILTCLLINQSRIENSKNIWMGSIILLGFLIPSLKEEASILSLFFFGIHFLFTRDKRYLWLSLISAGFLFTGFQVITHLQTSFNRSNTALVNGLIKSFQEIGLTTFFYNSRGPQSTVITFWGFVISTMAFFHVFWLRRKQINPHIAALFYTGMLKIGASLLVLDFRLNSWHTLPGVVMIMVSLILLLAQNIQRNDLTRIFLGVCTVSLLLFISFELVPIAKKFWHNYLRTEDIADYQDQLRELKPHIKDNRLVSVPMFSMAELREFRIIDYPGGVQTKNNGLADYVIFPKDVSNSYTGNFDNLFPFENSSRDFEPIAQTANFTLYKRTLLSEADALTRINFFETFNLEELIPLPD